MRILENMRHAARWKLYSCFLMVVIADVFFYGHAIGWTAGSFALTALIVLLFFNPACLRRGFGQLVAVSTLGQCLLLANDPHLLSLVLYVIGLVSLCLLSRGIVWKDALTWLRQVCAFICRAAGRSFADINRHGKILKRVQSKGRLANFFHLWTLPIVATAIFAALFSSANPVIGIWTNAINWSAVFETLTWQRVLFWLIVLSLCWPLIRPKIRRLPPYIMPGGGLVPGVINWLFSTSSILRSLLMFNVLFAVQTIMDAAYLWGGQALPDGVTYAQYAHQGAYPLIVTALLAAVFVLIALRPGSASAQSRFVNGLIYGWILQNLLLVISSTQRMDLYVQEYSLTYPRLFALIWMGLVASGLALIVTRMALKKSNIWLINTNAFVLITVLYVCSAINLGGLIADYNVRHCREVTGQGTNLDYGYLSSLGPVSLPALQWLQDATRQPRPYYLQLYLSEYLERRQSDWRAWTYRNYRLSRAYHIGGP